mmetsp:Transcript_2141/g.8348  ORF Transcript_2141/g.8348 Transcript_2141/m.8348 type:complete len:81 (-) Transcript_2141:2642-2884(-)
MAKLGYVRTPTYVDAETKKINAAGAETFKAPTSFCPRVCVFVRPARVRVLVPESESESASRVPSPCVRVPSLGRARKSAA